MDLPSWHRTVDNSLILDVKCIVDLQTKGPIVIFKLVVDPCMNQEIGIQKLVVIPCDVSGRRIFSGQSQMPTAGYLIQTAYRPHMTWRVDGLFVCKGLIQDYAAHVLISPFDFQIAIKFFS